MRRSRSHPWWVLAVAGSTLVAAGCPPRPGDEAPPVLETEEVGPAFEEELDLSTDRKGASRGEAGQLPGGFPEGLPIYKPSTISDLGQGERGDFVQFMSPDAADKVRAQYPAALTRAGWSVETGPGGVLVASRAGRRARISIEASGPVSFIRVDY